MNWKKTALVGAAGAAVALAGVGAVNLWGRRVRSIRDELRDDPLTPPEDVEHVYLNTVDDGVLHTVVTGTGPPVVLLHGVTLQWWVWSAVIRLLRSDHRVIACDMRGHGESKAGTRGVTLEACADDLAQVLIEFDATDAVVVGHSMGGMVLGRFVIQNHEVAHDRVRGLVFLATSAAPVSIAALRGGVAALSGLVAPLARRDARRDRTSYPWKDTNVSAALARTAFGRHATARMVDDTRLMIAATPASTLSEAAASIAAHDVRAELASVDLPTVVVVGSLDTLTPPPHARVLAELVDGQRVARAARGRPPGHAGGSGGGRSGGGSLRTTAPERGATRPIGRVAPRSGCCRGGSDPCPPPGRAHEGEDEPDDSDGGDDQSDRRLSQYGDQHADHHDDEGSSNSHVLFSNRAAPLPAR